MIQFFARFLKDLARYSAELFCGRCFRHWAKVSIRRLFFPLNWPFSFIILVHYFLIFPYLFVQVLFFWALMEADLKKLGGDRIALSRLPIRNVLWNSGCTFPLILILSKSSMLLPGANMEESPWLVGQLYSCHFVGGLYMGTFYWFILTVLNDNQCWLV